VASIGALTLNIPVEVFSMEIEGTWDFADRFCDVCPFDPRARVSRDSGRPAFIAR
jgi:hypothetical protein